LGLLASVVFGVASVAPGYSLAATVGLIAAVVGLQGPFIMILAFIPMLLVSSGFYYMNHADPDCGETFIWTARAFGGPVGWVIGFAAVASSIIVMANLVQIASLYTFLLLGAHSAANSTFWVTVLGVGSNLLVRDGGIPGVVLRLIVEPEVSRTVSLVTVAGRRHTPAAKAVLQLAKSYRWEF